MNETDALLALNAVRGLGNARIRKLLKRFGSALTVMSLKEADLMDDRVIPAEVVRNILNFSQDLFLKSEYNLMNKQGVHAVSFLDDEYPQHLREIADAPVVLYVKGGLACADPLSLAIVGSRRASFYGVSVAEKFGRLLAEQGVSIVSGLARGIDTAAHKGALSVGGTCIAVVGCGLSNIYPLENKDLLEHIAKDGAVVSEFPMSTMPVAHNFPRRNRIISGLSMGVIVVEAALRSGALITADFALEQGREVYAVPGKIDQASAQGVNALIKQGAKLITSVEDVLEDIKPQIQPAITNRINDVKDIPELTDIEKSVFNQINDKPVHIDELSNGTNASISIPAILMQLELKQLVKQLPGKHYTR